MPKQVSEVQKKEMLDYFINGYEIDQISEKFNFSNQTIIRQLQNLIGKDEFLKIKKLKKNKGGKSPENSSKSSVSLDKDKDRKLLHNKFKLQDQDQLALYQDKNFDNQNMEDSFYEIVPLTNGIELEKQKDISSIPIDKFDFPKTVFMIVDNKIELEPKLLKQFPEWEFLPEEDLDRQTLEIFSDQKLAKFKCNKNQKLIKIPNAKVFLIASSFLKSRGISRVIYDNVLLSL